MHFLCIDLFISSLYTYRTSNARHQEIELYSYIIWYD